MNFANPSPSPIKSRQTGTLGCRHPHCRPRISAGTMPGFAARSPLPQSALPSSRRGGRSWSTRSASIAGYPGGQVINSGEEFPRDRGRVRLMISDNQIDGRRLAFERTADDRPLQEILCGGRQQSHTARRRDQRDGHREVIDLEMRHDVYRGSFKIIVDDSSQHPRHA